MKNQSSTGNPSTFQELASFLTVLNGGKSSTAPFLKKPEFSERVIFNLEKQFSRLEPQPVLYRLVKRQLSLNFS